jgi:hypothetical protein
MKNVPFPLPLGGSNVSTVSHEGALLTISQAEFELVHTEILRLPPTLPGLQVLCDSVRVVAGAWITEIVLSIAPCTATDMVPLRSVVPVFGAALMKNEPFPSRYGGSNVSTISHDGALLTTFQAELELVSNLTLRLPPSADTELHVVDDSVRVGSPAWIT